MTTKKEPTKYLDLDSFANEQEFVVKLKGIEHKLVSLTVNDFIFNTKLIQSLGTAPDIETELNAVIKMLTRAFPTMTEEMLRGMEIQKLNAILDFAHANNGQRAGEAEAKAEAATNP
jgi:hypothetical protein